MRIFITGGTTGIGLSLAEVYLQQGHAVAICGRDLSKLHDDFVEKHPQLKSYTVDVTKPDQVRAAITDFAQTGLDLVIANAGRSVGSKRGLPSWEIARQVIDINVIGVLNTFEVALEFMTKQRSGHLVAVSSVAGFIGLPGAGVYSASKAAVTKLCEGLQIDLKPYNIHVTTICPGFIDTPLTQQNNHPMPFIMPASKAALMIKNAIDKKKSLYIFPFPMKLAITLLDKMPRWLYRFLMGLKTVNYTKS